MSYRKIPRLKKQLKQCSARFLKQTLLKNLVQQVIVLVTLDLLQSPHLKVSKLQKKGKGKNTIASAVDAAAYIYELYSISGGMKDELKDIDF